MSEKMVCMNFYKEITPENDGIEILVGYQEVFCQCCDCHEIEFGTRIYATNLIFNGGEK